MEWDLNTLYFESSKADDACEGGSVHCSHSVDCERFAAKQEHAISIIVIVYHNSLYNPGPVGQCSPADL